MRKKKLKLTPYNLFGLIVISAFLAGTAYFLTMEPPSKEKICQQLLSEYDIPSDDYNKIFDTCIDKGPGDTQFQSLF